MSENNTGASAPAYEAVQQNVITLSFNQKKDSAPKENSVLAAVRVFVNKEIRRKQDEAARALLTPEQRQAFDLGAIDSYSDFFEENGIEGFPTKNGYQAEASTIAQNWDLVSAKSIKVFVKKLAEVGERRDYRVVFGEVLETYRNAPSNKYADLLG